MRKTATIAGWTFGGIILLVLAGFALLQTGPARRLLADTLSGMLANPGSAIQVGRIEGVVPFNVSVSRITLADDAGAWLTLDGVGLKWSPSALLRGTIRVDRASVALIEILRLPAQQNDARFVSPPPKLALPRLPFSVDLRDLRIARLAVAPGMAGGVKAEAAISGHGMLRRESAAVVIEASRTDGQPGRAVIDGQYDQPANTLALKIDLNEPTGVAMDALTGRADHLPLRMTLDGGGPLSDWGGNLRLASGAGIQANATVTIAHDTGTRVGVAGMASFASLLAENLRPLVGDTISFSVAGADDGEGGVMLTPSRVALASVTLDAEGGKSDDGALNGKLRITVPDAAAMGALAGQNAAGAISVDAVLSGTADRPQLALSEQGQIVFGQLAISGLAVNADVQSLSGLGAKDPEFAMTIDAKAADLRGSSDGASYGPLAVHFAGATDAAGKLIDVRELTAHGGGIDLTGVGRFSNGAGEGKAKLRAADLAVLGRLSNRPLGGTLTADVTVGTTTDRTVTASVNGVGDRLQTGIAAADAVLAGPVTVAAGLTISAAGKVALSSLAIESGRARLAASGSFDPADKSINGGLTANLNDLRALSTAMNSPLGGVGRISAQLSGTLDAPALEAEANLDRLSFQAMRIDHFESRIAAAQGLNGPASIEARIESGKLNETVRVTFARPIDQAYRFSDLRLSGTGGDIAGAAVIDPGRHMAALKLDGAIGDLSVWSGVAGQPVSGRIALAVNVPDGGRQGPVKVTVDHVTLGAGSTAFSINHAALTGSASGDYGRPAGTLDLAVGRVTAAGVQIDQASAHGSGKGDAEDFRLNGAGRLQEAVALEIAGSAAQSRGSTSVRLTRFAASVGANHLALRRPTTLTIAPGAYGVTGLALDVDGGSLAGFAAASPKMISADLTLHQVPLHPLAALAGKDAIGGLIDGRIILSGTPLAPEARLTLTTQGLDLETDGPLPRPVLSLSADAEWRGARAILNARLSAASGEKLTVSGSAPFAFDLATLKPLDAGDAALALKIEGSGRLENLTSIVPLGEDRITGALTINVAVGGTLSAPKPSGRITVTNGAYANMALGTQVTDIDLAVDGSGERFVLDHLTAKDGKSGALKASGSIDLAAKPATVALALGFTDFLVAQSDDATVAADGALNVDGNRDTMKASGTVSVRHAELYIPERLPSSVVNLNVVEVGGNRKIVDAPKAKPVAVVALQIALDAPGQVFVRGHGITSEWRSHIDVSGTSAAPGLNGQLEVVSGNISLIGQSFVIDRGIVRFDGGGSIDPVLDVQASATASSVTATVNVTGTARAPKIALSSIPALPQDEILAQVLFGSTLSSLTASQGLQLAAAAASLAQGGPGVLDRVRTKIGLDRLDIGSGGSNPYGTQGAAKGTTVTGGKYIANGVLVGVSQGITTNSSQALVQVEITPHISVNSTFGAASGSGFGAKYSIDY